MGRIAIEMAGQRFGMLTCLEKTRSVHAGAIWLCKCDCGEKREVLRSHLVNGRTKSCGCSKSNHIKGTYLNGYNKMIKENKELKTKIKSLIEKLKELGIEIEE